MAIIEVAIPSGYDVPPPEPPEGYEPITLEEIHEKGYLSPSEARTEAEKQGYIDKKEDGEKGCGSWISAEYVPQQPLKRVYCGSYTSRSFWPGKLFLRCQTKRSGQWVYDSGPYWTCVWYTSAGYSATYPKTVSFVWDQYGWHRWAHGQTPVESHVYRVW